jgi:hypothetical protein
MALELRQAQPATTGPPLVLQVQMRLRAGALFLVNAIRLRHQAKGLALHAWADAVLSDVGRRAPSSVPSSEHDF